MFLGFLGLYIITSYMCLLCKVKLYVIFILSFKCLNMYLDIIYLKESNKTSFIIFEEIKY